MSMTNSFVFVSSKEEDAATVDLIAKNLKSFSLQAAAHGYKVSIHCLKPKDVVVRLTSTDGSSDHLKIVEILQKLVKIKKSQYSRLRTDIRGLISAMRDIQQYINGPVDELVKKNFSLRYLAIMKLFEIRKTNRRIKSLLAENTEKLYNENGFFNMSNMQLIRESPWIIDRICQKLSGVAISSGRLWIRPFEQYSSVIDKRNELNALLDILQGGEDDMDAPITALELYLRTRYKHFLYRPTTRQLDIYKLKTSAIYNVDNVIGTIHTICVSPFDGTHIYGIIDKHIVFSAWCDEDGDIVDVLHDYLKKDKRRVCSMNYEFATSLQVDDKYSEFLVHVDKKELYQENEKVMKWLKNNFECLDYWMGDDQSNTMVCIYQLCYRCF